MSNKYLSKPSTFMGRLKERMANVFGYIGPAETIDKKIENLDNSISVNDDSGFSLIVQSKIYGDVINKYEQIVNDIKDKLLNGGNFTGRAQLYQLQVLKHQSMILLAKTSDQIVNAKMEFNSVLEKTCQDYFNSILGGDFNDIYVLNLVDDINSILQKCSNLNFPFVAIKGFNDLKIVYEYSEKNKCIIDRRIEKNQTRIQLIKADPKTINAYASREAISSKKR